MDSIPKKQSTTSLGSHGSTRAIFLHSDALEAFRAYDGYPWLFARSAATLALCRRHGLLDREGVELYHTSPATIADAARFHDAGYLRLLRQANEGTFVDSMLEQGLGTVECPVYPGCLDYHLSMLGGSLAGVEWLLQPQVNLAFAPTGGMHHAGPDFASGFCYLNDAVLAIQRFLDLGQRVLYVDFDAHHGDGVQSAFYASDQVLTISFHESPETLFPFVTGFFTEVGEGVGEGFNVNIPLTAGSGDRVFSWTFEHIVPPLAEAFRPDVLVAVVGPDLLVSDPLTHLKVTTEGYCQAVGWLTRLAPKALVFGCGGYHLESVSRALTLAWAVLNNVPVEDDAELLFGGVFRGDGLLSLMEPPIVLAPEEEQKAMAGGETCVRFVEAFHFPRLGARPGG